MTLGLQRLHALGDFYLGPKTGEAQRIASATTFEKAERQHPDLSREYKPTPLARKQEYSVRRLPIHTMNCSTGHERNCTTADATTASAFRPWGTTAPEDARLNAPSCSHAVAPKREMQLPMRPRGDLTFFSSVKRGQFYRDSCQSPVLRLKPSTRGGGHRTTKANSPSKRLASLSDLLDAARRIEKDLLLESSSSPSTLPSRLADLQQQTQRAHNHQQRRVLLRDCYKYLKTGEEEMLLIRRQRRHETKFRTHGKKRKIFPLVPSLPPTGRLAVIPETGPCDQGKGQCHHRHRRSDSGDGWSIASFADRDVPPVMSPSTTTQRKTPSSSQSSLSPPPPPAPRKPIVQPALDSPSNPLPLLPN